jgi:hypothetical protein
MVRWRGAPNPEGRDPFSPAGLKEKSRYRFYATGESYRADYLDGPNDKTVLEALVETPQRAYVYDPASTADDSRATLFRYRDPKTIHVRMRVDADVRSLIYSLLGVNGSRAIDCLVVAGVKLAATKSSDVPNGLTILYSYGGDASGETKAIPCPPDVKASECEIVLDRDNDFAVRRCKVKTTAVGGVGTLERTIRITRNGGSTIVPKEVASAISFVGRPPSRVSQSYREVVRIDYSPATVNERTFTEAGLAALGHDYTVVDVDQRDTTRAGKTGNAVPPESQPRPSAGGGGIESRSRRTPFLIANVIAIVILISVFCLRQIRKRRR